jgi:hypothetical protein
VKQPELRGRKPPDQGREGSLTEKSFRRRYAEMRARQLASGEKPTRAELRRTWRLFLLIMVPLVLFSACCSWALVRMVYGR